MNAQQDQRIKMVLWLIILVGVLLIGVYIGSQLHGSISNVVTR